MKSKNKQLKMLVLRLSIASIFLVIKFNSIEQLITASIFYCIAFATTFTMESD